MSNLRDQLQIARINTMRQRMRQRYHLAHCEACRARAQAWADPPLQALFKALGVDSEPEPTPPTPNKAH